MNDLLWWFVIFLLGVLAGIQSCILIAKRSLEDQIDDLVDLAARKVTNKILAQLIGMKEVGDHENA